MKRTMLFVLFYCICVSSLHAGKSVLAASARGIVISDSVPTSKNHDTTIVKVEIEASYPGGDVAWNKYVSDGVNDHIDELSRHTRAGTYSVDVRFSILTNGTVGDAVAINIKHARLAKVAVDAITNSKRWHPAMQNGRPVKAFRIQPVSFAVGR